MKFGIAVGLAGFILSVIFGSAFVKDARTVSEAKFLEHHGITVEATVIESYSENHCSSTGACSLKHFARYQFEDAQGQTREGTANWREAAEPVMLHQTGIKILVDPMDGARNKALAQVRDIGRGQFLIGAIATFALLMMAIGAAISFVGYHHAKEAGQLSLQRFLALANFALGQFRTR